MAFNMNYKKGGFPFKSAFKQIPTFVGLGSAKNINLNDVEKERLIELAKKEKKKRAKAKEFREALNANSVDITLPTAVADNTRVG